MGQQFSPNDVLLVDDDDTFAEELGAYLISHGFEVDRSKTMEQAFERITNNMPDIVILDQFLGTVDSLSMINQLRQQFSGGLMVLTGNVESTDRIVGLELGADDFVSKVISPREILARLRSLLRRPQAYANSASEEVLMADNRPHIGRWVLDTSRHELFGPDGQLVHLTSAEFGTLRHLNAHKGQPVSRDDLSRAVLHRRFDALDRSIDNLVSRLRKKFESLDPNCRVLKTVRGEGYVFVGFDHDEARH
jgi:two-component system OmpR family response regulator